MLCGVFLALRGVFGVLRVDVEAGADDLRGVCGSAAAKESGRALLR